MNEHTDSLLTCDINRILIRPVYFGMGVNVLAPTLLLFAHWYYDQNYGQRNLVGEFDVVLFGVLAVFTVAQAVWCLWQQGRRLKRRIAQSKETMGDDLATGLLAVLKPVFYAAAAVSLYGFVYYWLTGQFRGAVVFVVVALILFQVLRPRHGTVEKVIERQQIMLSANESSVST